VIALVHPALLLVPGERMNQAARVYADYLVARDLAVAIVLGVLPAMRVRRMLAGLLVLTALIQLLDAGLDAATGRLTLVPGLLVLTVTFLVGAGRLCGRRCGRLPPGGTPRRRRHAPIGNPTTAEQLGSGPWRDRTVGSRRRHRFAVERFGAMSGLLLIGW
jgi:hypothetical protein